MKKLVIAGAVALGLGVGAAACGSDSTKNGNDQNNQGAQCFSGTPTTNDQIITACTASTDIAIDIQPVVKHKKADGTLPTPPDPLP